MIKVIEVILFLTSYFFFIFSKGLKIPSLSSPLSQLKFFLRKCKRSKMSKNENFEIAKRRRSYLLGHDSRKFWNPKFVDLTVEHCVEIMKTKNCHWCKTKLRYKTQKYKKKMNPRYMTFDRIFSDMPHHHWNIVAACWKCNCRIRKNLL